jgi:hypothetical protein
LAKLVLRYNFFDGMPAETKDRLIAPKISELSAPNIPDISTRRNYPLNNFIMNINLSLVLTNGVRQATFNFIRNAEAAFDTYCDGRKALFDYLQVRASTAVSYFSALRHFEHCLAHLYHAVRSVNVLGKEKQFEPGDGSVLERASILHNHIKHMDGIYERAAIRDEISFKLFATRSDGSGSISYDFRDAANVPLWLTNSGLECRKTALTYKELADELLSVLDEAVNIAGLKPPKAKASPSVT